MARTKVAYTDPRPRPTVDPADWPRGIGPYCTCIGIPAYDVGICLLRGPELEEERDVR